MTDGFGGAVRTVPKGLYLAGQWRPSSSGKEFAVRDPATGVAIAQVADATVEDGLEALRIAAQTQASWAATAPRQRGEILRAAFEAMVDQKDQFAELITMEMGKPLADSHSEVAYAAEFFRWFSEEAVRLAGSWTQAPDGASRFLTMRQPVGPSLLVTPWNFPLAMVTRKLGPALAAGCTAIIKPSSRSPLTVNAVIQVLESVGLPAGVVAVIPTSNSSGVVEAIMADPRLRKVSFTGSTETGRQLIEQGAHNVLRMSMELGGNAPLIVFADADLDQAVEEAMKAKMRSNAEACTAANRFFVHRSVRAAFVERLSAKFFDLRVGPGYESTSTVGPLIDAKAVAKVRGLVDAAVDGGAKPVFSGNVPEGDGFFFPPVILQDVAPTSEIMRHEIFGPVVAVAEFDTDEQAISLANDTEFGLVAYIFTKSLERAIKVAEALETGMVGVNRGVISNPAAPFGGVKMSGFGREGGAEGVDEYLETKYVNIGF